MAETKKTKDKKNDKTGAKEKEKEKGPHQEKGKRAYVDVSSSSSITEQDNKRRDIDEDINGEMPDVDVDACEGAESETPPMTRPTHLTAEITSYVEEKFFELLKQIADLRLETRAKDEKIVKLENKLDDTFNAIDEIYLILDDHEQYSRRKNIRISGVEESIDEDTVETVKKCLIEELGTTVLGTDIERAHRLGVKSENTDTRPIIIEFSSRRTKDGIMEKLRGGKKKPNSDIRINEDLTSQKVKLAKRAREMKKEGLLQRSWTRDGKIKIRTNTDNVRIVRSWKDLDLEPSEQFGAQGPQQTVRAPPHSGNRGTGFSPIFEPSRYNRYTSTPRFHGNSRNSRGWNFGTGRYIRDRPPRGVWRGQPRGNPR